MNPEDKQLLLESFELPIKSVVDVFDPNFPRNEQSHQFYVNAQLKVEQIRSKQSITQTFKYFDIDTVKCLTVEDIQAIHDECSFISNFEKLKEIAKLGYFHTWILKSHVLACYKDVIQALSRTVDELDEIMHIITHNPAPELVFMLLDSGDRDILERYKESIFCHPRDDVKVRLIEKGIIPRAAYVTNSQSVKLALIRNGHINPQWYECSDVQVKLALLEFGDYRRLKHDPVLRVRLAYIEKSKDISDLLSSENILILDKCLHILDTANKAHSEILNSYLKKNHKDSSQLSEYVFLKCTELGIFGMQDKEERRALSKRLKQIKNELQGSMLIIDDIDFSFWGF